jgi:hypothetical protein
LFLFLKTNRNFVREEGEMSNAHSIVGQDGGCKILVVLTALEPLTQGALGF